jgi:hypothetical protein
MRTQLARELRTPITAAHLPHVHVHQDVGHPGQARHALEPRGNAELRAHMGVVQCVCVCVCVTVKPCA